MSFRKLLFMPMFLVIASLASCNSNKPVEATFANDTWENVIKYANEGIDSLINHYHPSNDTFVITRSDSSDEIKNKTRLVEIEGLGTFEVIVIGECVNDISEGDNQVATLTFAFKECISCAPINNKVDTFYVDSFVHNYLYQDILTKFPKVLVDNMDNVIISSYYDESGTLKNSVEKIFLPSSFEIAGMNSADKEEGEEYPYASIHITNQSKIKHFNNQPITYWTRTYDYTDITSGDMYYYAIAEDGRSISSVDPNQIFGISPLFAIGTNKKIKSIYTQSSNMFFASSTRYDFNSTSITNYLKPLTYKYKDGKESAATQIHNKSEVYGYLDKLYYENILSSYNNDTGEFAIEGLTDQKVIVLEVSPLDLIIDYDQLTELVDVDEGGNFNGDFIKKYVNIGDYKRLAFEGGKYTFIEIIGIAHDTYNIDNETKKAALTFDLYQNDLAPIFTKEINYSDGNDNSCYASSNVHRYLNSSENDTFLAMIKNSNESLYNHIKVCDKPMYHAIGNYDTNTWEVTDVPCKVWLLSAIEADMHNDSEARADSTNYEDGYPYEFYSMQIYGRNTYLKNVSGGAWKLRTPSVSGEERSNQYMSIGHEMAGWAIHYHDAIVPYCDLNPSFAI